MRENEKNNNELERNKFIKKKNELVHILNELSMVKF